MQLTLAPKPPAPSDLSPPAGPAEDVLEWLKTRFAKELAYGRVVMTTSFGMEGCVLIDLIDRAGLDVPIIYLDTGFFFEETHDLRRRLEQRYPRLAFINRGTDLSPEDQARQFGPELWKSDPAACCDLRKVEPMRDVMEGVDVWLTALRRGQSKTRANLPIAGVDAQYGVVKVSPLAEWDRPQVWQYIQAHDVPYNVLHERGYPTVGCTHCTKAVPGSQAWDYSREGRWAGTEKTECGLHWSDYQI